MRLIHAVISHGGNNGAAVLTGAGGECDAVCRNVAGLSPDAPFVLRWNEVALTATVVDSMIAGGKLDAHEADNNPLRLQARPRGPPGRAGWRCCIRAPV